MVKDTGRRDSAGLEDMDAFFSPTGTPRKGKSSPAKLVSSYKTKLQSAMQYDATASKNNAGVLASRKSLLAQRWSPIEFAYVDRSPQKTYLKSPAVRIQTPK